MKRFLKGGVIGLVLTILLLSCQTKSDSILGKWNIRDYGVEVTLEFLPENKLITIDPFGRREGRYEQPDASTLVLIDGQTQMKYQIRFEGDTVFMTRPDARVVKFVRAAQ